MHCVVQNDADCAVDGLRMSISLEIFPVHWALIEYGLAPEARRVCRAWSHGTYVVTSVSRCPPLSSKLSKLATLMVIQNVDL